MAIFNSYGSLPEGSEAISWGMRSILSINHPTWPVGDPFFSLVTRWPFSYGYLVMIGVILSYNIATNISTNIATNISTQISTQIWTRIATTISDTSVSRTYQLIYSSHCGPCGPCHKSYASDMDRSSIGDFQLPWWHWSLEGRVDKIGIWSSVRQNQNFWYHHEL